MTVGEVRPVNCSSLEILRPMSTSGRRTSAVIRPCFETVGSYFSMYIRTVAPTEPAISFWDDGSRVQGYNKVGKPLNTHDKVRIPFYWTNSPNTPSMRREKHRCA